MRITLNKVKKKRGFLHRSRVDIIACILENATGQSRKTNLIYKCNLSLAQCNLYLDLLNEAGLLRKNNPENKIVFATTEKGKTFLKDYKKLKTILDKMRM